VLVTGHDIIFFWVARMIMFGLRFAGEVPFRDVYIHGLVRDHEGQKMSKSKGNILDPIDLIDGIGLESLVAKRTEAMMNPALKPAIEKATRGEFPDGIPAFGTDALRMTFASLATQGRDLRFDFGRIDGYHKFCNKLWNATEYVFVQIERSEPGDAVELGVADRWIRSRLSACIAAVRSGFDEYRFDLANQAVYEFVWHEFCDWYLELTKPVLGGESATAAEKRGARETLTTVLGTAFRLLHPIVPFVTEELWLALGAKSGRPSATIMLESFPEAADFARDDDATAEIEWLKGFIVGVRQIRGEMNLSPARPLPLCLAGGSDLDRQRVARNRAAIDRLARIGNIEWIDTGASLRGVATALLGDLRILIPLAGLVDPAREIDRLEKQIRKLANDLAQTERKLGNESFVANAPADIVAKERDRATDLAARRTRMAAQLEKLREIA
jgi:valyl-tRNA synthetase